MIDQFMCILLNTPDKNELEPNDGFGFVQLS